MSVPNLKLANLNLPDINASLDTIEGLKITDFAGSLPEARLSFGIEKANLIFSGPASGNDATPAWRALVAADIPSLDAAKITTGQLALARGGTGADLSATGGANKFVKQSTLGGALSVAPLVAGDVPDVALSSNVPLKNATNTFSAKQTISSGGEDVTGGLNAADGNLQLNAQQFQCWTLSLMTPVATLQHRIHSDANTVALGNYSGKISGASATLANTPSVSNVVGFTSGGGVNSSNTTQFVLDTADQVSLANVFGLASVSYNDTGTAVNVSVAFSSLNVNGVTRIRPYLTFTNASTGAGFFLNTTNIAAGKSLVVQVIACLK